MNHVLDQARAVLTLMEGAATEPAVASRAMTLARGLVDRGEFSLARDLCVASSATGLGYSEELESRLLQVQCLLNLGEIASAAAMLDRIGSAADDSVAAPPSLNNLRTILRARLHWFSQNFIECRELLLGLREQLLREPDSSDLGWCSHYLGNVSWSLGDATAARRYLVEAAASAFRRGDIRLEAVTALSAGLLKRSFCHWSEAREELARAHRIFAELGNAGNAAHAIRSLSIVDWKRGRLEIARENATTAWNNSGGAIEECLALELLALVEIHSGNLGEARSRVGAVRELPMRGMDRSVLLADEIEGDIELESGDSKAALAKYEAVLLQATSQAPKGDIVAELRRRRAECFHLLDRHDEALVEAKLGITHCRELGDRYEEAATYRVAAMAAASLGRPDEAREFFEQGFTLYEDIETPYEWGRLWMAFGDWLASDLAGAYRDPRLALEAYHAAHYRFESMGANARLADANARIARLSTLLQSGVVTMEPRVAEAAPVVVPSPPRSRASRSREVQRKTEWAAERFSLLTANASIIELLEKVEKLAPSRAPVLVLGESGTGKELIAQALHKLSGRRGEFVAINCATLPREVIESELFGHVAGAFTGATRDKVGLLEVCEGGTVFLDEVSEMSTDLQSRLLRFLESGELRRVGATKVHRVTTRVVAASNREGAELRSGKQFRSDLYYRLANAVILLPALRRRGPADVGLLARHFLERACLEEGKRVTLSDAAIQRLMTHSWPGNVRELKSIMFQHVVLARDGAEIQADDVHFDATATPGSLDEELAQTERRRIEEALRVSNNSKADAARILAMPRTTLINRMKRLGIDPD